MVDRDQRRTGMESDSLWPLRKIPPRRRRQVVTAVAFVLGVAAGAGALLWWQSLPPPEPAPTPLVVDEHDVELVLFAAEPPRDRPRGGESGTGPLRVDAGVFLSGSETSTISGIESRAGAFHVRAPALPVTISPADRFQPVELRITVRDCAAATGWTAGEAPFMISWRDDHGSHLDLAGEFDAALARAVARYIDAACGAGAR